MRTVLRIGLALLVALACSTTAAAQPSERLTINASIGPSFANLGTTLSTTAGVDVKLQDRVSLVGELGLLPHAPFQEASEILPPSVGTAAERINAYHWNGNLKLRPFETRRIEPYLTAGIGSFTADVLGASQTVNGLTIQDRRRVSDLATNLGAGVSYRLNDWVGVNADYRSFFVHRAGNDPRVHRFTTGLAFVVR